MSGQPGGEHEFKKADAQQLRQHEQLSPEPLPAGDSCEPEGG